MGVCVSHLELRTPNWSTTDTAVERQRGIGGVVKRRNTEPRHKITEAQRRKLIKHLQQPACQVGDMS